MVVIGDLIVDEYINCEPLGLSQEDPTIVVTPIRHDRFIGGAGIVAAHAQGLGAQVNYFGVVGEDETANDALSRLKQYGVVPHLTVDHSRPTTLKQRYRANGKTLLRVSHLRQHEISRELSKIIEEQVMDALTDCNLLIFSDFNYGCLPQKLVDKILKHCKKNNICMAADSQASSQLSDISRYQGVDLVTPTEYEARLALRDHASSLVVLANKLKKISRANNIFIKLGSEGLHICAPSHTGESITDQLPAFNNAPQDVSGAGDSMLTAASMTLAVSGDVWKAGYLGSIAAACQVGRVGNLPLTRAELLEELCL